MDTRKPAVVEVAPDTYQPTKAELEEDVSLKGPEGMDFDEAVKRILRPVELSPTLEMPKRRKRR